jgi:hypothetical protein
MRGGEDLGGGDQRGDLLIGVEERDRAPRPARQHAGRRNLHVRVSGVQVASEPADGLQSMRVIARMPARADRPRDCVIDRDPLLATFLEILDELREEPLGGVELVAHGSTDRQIIGQRVTQRAHPDVLPGHGLASCRSPSRSTFA